MTEPTTETWNLTIQTPIGPQASVATFVRDGASLGGRIEGRMGGEAITDGRIDGDVLTWVNDVQKPAKIKLAFTAMIEGDTLTGKVKMGLFGSFNVTGQRQNQ